MGIDHRQFDRLPAQNKVKVRGQGRHSIYAIAINLSLGGILLSASPSLPVGSTCRLTLFNGQQHTLLVQGEVVRSDAQGTAIQFAKTLAPENLQGLVAHGGPMRNAFLDAYLAYFQVGRNERNSGCERLLGVSLKTFRTVFYSTFSACLPLAVAPVWFLRASIQAYPVWEKLAACFLYGAVWYLLIQPSMDLAILHFLKKRRMGAPALKG